MTITDDLRIIARNGTIEDIAKLHALGAEYYERRGQPCADLALADFLLRALNDANKCFFVTGNPARGLLTGICGPHPRTGEICAEKTAWWVSRRTRGAYLPLQRAFEDWAKQQRATRIFMAVASWAPKAGKFMELRGYRLRETVYEKEI